MRVAFAPLLLALIGQLVHAGPAQALQATPEAPPPLPWAYPVAAVGGGGQAAAPAADEPLTLPGSNARFTLTQIRNGFDVADWRPDLHGPMPEVVSRGRAPDLRACGFCHMPNGQGRPENSSLAGQPVDYIIEQMRDFRADRRVSSESRMGPPRAMIAVAKAATDEEVRAAAEYFSALTFRPWIRVVETNTVPVTTIAGGMFVPVAGGGTEPIGNRILEVPEDPARTELRDPASSFVAYVPEGSVARGMALVTTGGGVTVQCSFCHGDDMGGLAAMPALAGRSPSYNARQLWDFKSGARQGAQSHMMTPVVRNLTPEDILAIAAYLATLEP